MENQKPPDHYLLGKNREAIPNIACHIMTFTMKLMDIFLQYSRKNFKTLLLKYQVSTH
jgi:hypothetical protein